MPWRGRSATFCHRCGGHVSEVGRLSARYNCQACGDREQILTKRELVAHSGPRFEYWRRRTLAAFGVSLETAPSSSEGD